MTEVVSWQRRPFPSGLAANAVHLWWVELSSRTWRVETLRSLLAPDESARAVRYAVATVQEKFVIGRGVLRLILGRYLRASPRHLRFAAGPGGRPELAAPGRPRGFRFSFAHSGSAAVCAVTLHRDVGIDLERMRSDLDFMAIAAGYLGPAEVVHLHRTALSLRSDTFYRYWTRKEARLKARGMGLATAAEHDCHAPDTALGLFDQPVPEPGYVATLAVEGVDHRISRWLATPTLLELSARTS